jgi:DNA-binding NarL/FixJ family response regulator
MQPTVKVLIADDHPRSRSGLRALLTTSPEIQIVGEAEDGREAIRLATEHKPDVILLDAKMPVMDGLEAARQVKSCCPQTKVILLTMYGTCLPAALMAGVDAFLVKGCPIEKIWEAILKPRL